MKNLHVIPTENYSPLVHSTNKYGGFFKSEHYSPMKEMGDSYQNIYITSDEEVKEGDWYFKDGVVGKCDKYPDIINGYNVKKIILTTDVDLIADGVQAIDDEFLNWFVKNPKCEEVEVKNIEVEDYAGFAGHTSYPTFRNEYKIIIPIEEPKQDYKMLSEEFTEALKSIPDDVLLEYAEPKQETIEEAAERIFNIPDDKKGDVYFGSNIAHLRKGFKFGAAWQAERMYSEEEMVKFMQYIVSNQELEHTSSVSKDTAKYYLEQFKKQKS